MWSRGIIAVEALVVQLRAVRHHDAKRPTSRVEQIQCRWEGLESGDALVRSWLRMESWRGYGLCGCAERGGVLALLIVFLFKEGVGMLVVRSWRGAIQGMVFGCASLCGHQGRKVQGAGFSWTTA